MDARALRKAELARRRDAITDLAASQATALCAHVAAHVATLETAKAARLADIAALTAARLQSLQAEIDACDDASADEDGAFTLGPITTPQLFEFVPLLADCKPTVAGAVPHGLNAQPACSTQAVLHSSSSGHCIRVHALDEHGAKILRGLRCIAHVHYRYGDWTRTPKTVVNLPCGSLGVVHLEVQLVNGTVCKHSVALPDVRAVCEDVRPVPAHFAQCLRKQALLLAGEYVACLMSAEVAVFKLPDMATPVLLCSLFCGDMVPHRIAAIDHMLYVLEPSKNAVHMFDVRSSDAQTVRLQSAPTRMDTTFTGIVLLEVYGQCAAFTKDMKPIPHRSGMCGDCLPKFDTYLLHARHTDTLRTVRGFGQYASFAITAPLNSLTTNTLPMHEVADHEVLGLLGDRRSSRLIVFSRPRSRGDDAPLQLTTYRIN